MTLTTEDDNHVYVRSACRESYSIYDNTGFERSCPFNSLLLVRIGEKCCLVTLALAFVLSCLDMTSFVASFVSYGSTATLPRQEQVR
jgi:hypothetical protein